jgi:hypothetical protein
MIRRRISVEEKKKFLMKHYIIAKPALISKVGEYRRMLVELARVELGYSKNTVDVDIILILHKVFVKYVAPHTR